MAHSWLVSSQRKFWSKNLKKGRRLCLLSQEQQSHLGQENDGNVGYPRLGSVCARDEDEEKLCSKNPRPHMDITNFLRCWMGLGSLEATCPWESLSSCWPAYHLQEVPPWNQPWMNKSTTYKKEILSHNSGGQSEIKVWAGLIFRSLFRLTLGRHQISSIKEIWINF